VAPIEPKTETQTLPPIPEVSDPRQVDPVVEAALWKHYQVSLKDLSKAEAFRVEKAMKAGLAKANEAIKEEERLEAIQRADNAKSAVEQAKYASKSAEDQEKAAMEVVKLAEEKTLAARAAISIGSPKILQLTKDDSPVPEPVLKPVTEAEESFITANAPVAKAPVTTA
jgi:hypothetical protein